MSGHPSQQNKIWAPAGSDYGTEVLLREGDLYFNTATKKLRQCRNPAGPVWEDVGVEGNVLVYQPGGIAGGIVYTTWSSLYTAASVIAGPVTVFIDDSAGTPEVSAGSYDLHGWVLEGVPATATGARPVLTILTGVALAGNFKTKGLSLILAAGASTPILYGMATTRVFEIEDSDWDGGGGNGIVAVGAAGPGVTLDLKGNSSVLGGVVALSAGVVAIRVRDQSTVDGDTITGAGGTVFALVIDPDTCIVRSQVGYAGTFLLIGSRTDRLVIDAEQLGTAELHVGSVKLTMGTRILSTSAAMIGGSAIGETANLRIRRFTGGASVATWTRLGTLGEDLLGGDVPIVDTDWYDIYLYAGGAAETAIAKGLTIYTIQE